MATTTKRYALLKKDPSTDGNDTFNIKTMLNDNFDKLDEAAKKTELDDHINDKDKHVTADDKKKLDGIETGANKYVHPSSHPATMITEDSNHRFVTDTEKANWNGKAGTSVATQTANGLMSKEDKTKLDGVETGANKYTHPA
ncbi:hypothetical protein ACQKP0_24790, partial [Heyndrickxia sp. NPDC080065]|uniref:hypothetical protein n=1 Tax=Heyndrickxia sp. NPDC080065 TaxID=3390568 RepID=UPI003D02F2AC